MTASVFDSALYTGLFPTGEAGRLFAATAEVRAMLLVQGTLAKVQGDLGVIPADSAAFIHRSSMEVQIDPAGLAQATGQNGVPVPALVAAFRKAMEAPEHAQYAHWGATSQDIMDTGLMLRLRQALGLVRADLQACLTRLADLAEAHADTPMAGRTYGQHATPVTFGAVVSTWGWPLAGLLDEAERLKAECLMVSLSGAAGTGAALGAKAGETRAALAQALSLKDPERSWHTDRSPFLRLADWFTRSVLALAKIGEDVIGLTQTGIAELSLGQGGASSTMPQKQNPVAASALVALARQQAAQMQALQGAAVHQHQRDGAAWFTEWMTLPQIVLGAASAAGTGKSLLQGLSPDAAQMAAALHGNLGLIHAEAISFALATQMPRPEAQAETKRLCAEAAATGTPLPDLMAAQYPAAALDTGTGSAARDAHRFAQSARSRA